MPVLDSYPLSPLQQGMLFHLLRSPRAGQDVEQIVTTFPEIVDADAMRAAWQLVVDRHDVLRTSFRWEGLDEPVQEVHDAAPLPFEVLDWRALGEEERERRLAEFFADDRRRNFDPARAPLKRVTLLLTGERESRVVWSYHHILIDGLSMRFVLREALAAYDALRRGEAVALPPAPMPYRRFIEWRGRLDVGGSRAYWRELLAGFSAPTAVPVARSAPAGEPATRRGNTGVRFLGESTTSRLRELAAAHGATMNTLVQGAWALLLARYSGDEDVTFGVVRRGRPRELAGVDDAIGMFITTVPVRVPVVPEAPVLDVVQRLRAQWVALREHEQSPLSDIRSWAGIPANVSLFDTLFVFDASAFAHWIAVEDPHWDGRRLALLEQPGYLVSAKCYDGERLWLELDYDPARLAAPAAQAMLDHFATLLEGMAAGLDVPARSLGIATPAERQQLLFGFNATHGAYRRDRCVHHLVEEQARRTPDAVAVRAGETGRQLTYAELDARAGAVAAHLRELGVGPDVCVGICLERSPEMMIAVLATLKAGGAYVPLDPSYPAERLAYMLETARAPVVLTQRTLTSVLPETAARVVLLDEPLPDATSPLPAAASTPDDLCYVIFTSGSTGRPKGVAMPHRALVNLLGWQLARARVGPGDATLQFSSLSFDVSFQEIFSTWSAGGTLVLVSEELRRDAARLLDYLRDERVGRLFLPFIALQQLAQVAEDAAELPRSLREVITAGEQLQSSPQVVRLFERLGGCLLENQYGPTESHVVTAYTLAGPPAQWPALPPIGKPITNSRIYILAPGGTPVPVGVPGELFIAGVCLAHGYLHRPELTAERFLPDPFVPGERMYRTGDLARWLADGDIEYLGRVDHQVKIRGYRVELGEIEAVIAAHPEVRECAVMARDSGGGKQLVAWVAPVDGAAPTPSELRDHVARALPEHMVPTAYVSVATMPLTPSGKVDRRNLPAPDETSLPVRASHGEDAAPRDVVELRLTVLWERLLGRHGIGRHDDFFDLGGHSLLAVSLFGQIRRLFGRDLPLVTLFEAPTIAQLAERLRDGGGDAEWSTIVALQPMGTRPPLVCVPGGGGILLGYRDLVPHLPPDQPVYGLQPPALSGTGPHFETIEAMAAHYVEALRRVQPHGPYYLEGWCIGGLTALEMAQQLRAAGEEVRFLLLVDTTFPHPKPSVLRRLAHHGRQARRLPLDQGIRYIARESMRILGSRFGARRGAAREEGDDRATRGGASAATPGDATAAYVLDAEWDAAARYRPLPYAGHLLLYWPTEKPEEGYVDSPASWDAIALGGATHRRIEGSHHSMFLEPLVRGLAATLAADLRAAQDAPAHASGDFAAAERSLATSGAS